MQYVQTESALRNGHESQESERDGAGSVLAHS
jgi:hypothetical protein